MRKHLLFVTRQNEEHDEGLSYAIELAKTLDEGITILVLSMKKLGQTVENFMAAVAFAEAGEHDTARMIANGDEGSRPLERSNAMLEQCRQSGIEANLQMSDEGPVAAVSNFLKNRKAVDMVLLSPNVTRAGSLTAKELQKLVRKASRPVVTITNAKHELQPA